MGYRDNFQKALNCENDQKRDALKEKKNYLDNLKLDISKYLRYVTLIREFK